MHVFAFSSVSTFRIRIKAVVEGSETATGWPDHYAHVSYGFNWIRETICREVPDDEVFCVRESCQQRSGKASKQGTKL